MKRTFGLTALLCVSFWLSFANGIAFVGEGWFVQVIHRVTGGAVLYRDVTYGAGPLPVYLAAGAARFAGANILLLKSLVAAAWAVTLWLGSEILRELGCPRVVRAGYIVTSLLLAPTPLSPFYQAMATMFMMAAYWAAIKATRGLAVRPLVLAALFAGFGAASKQNVGIYAFLALLPCSMALLRSRGSSDVATFCWVVLKASLAFGLAVLLFLAPAILMAGFEEVWECTVANKGAYVSVGHVSFTTGFRDAWDRVKGAEAIAAPFYALQAGGFFVAPISLAVPFCAWLLHTATYGRVFVPIACFSAAAFAGIFPRVDLVHVTYMLPVLLVGGWWGAWLCTLACRRRPARVNRTSFRFAVMSLPVLLLVLNAARPGLEWLRGKRTVCRLPGFTGPLVPAAQEKRLQRVRADLAARLSGRPVFFLSPRAGFWYRTLGTRNLTAVDFPYRTLLSVRRRQEIISAVRDGQIHVACVEAADTPLWPRELEAQLEAESQFADLVGPLRIFDLRRPVATRDDVLRR